MATPITTATPTTTIIQSIQVFKTIFFLAVHFTKSMLVLKRI
jgi:hypothetical protein